MNIITREKVGFFLGPLAFFLILISPLNLEPSQHKLLAILLWVIIWWVTEAVPLAITSLLGPTLVVICRVAGVEESFSNFAHPVNMLLLGSFIIADAMVLHGLDRRIALNFLSIRAFSRSPFLILCGVAFITYLLSMWIANTATTAMMFPIVLGIIRTIPTGEEKKVLTYATALMLVVCYSASIGGISTPVGTPPNLIGMGFLENKGIIISFFDWMKVALPISFCTLLILLLLLRSYLPKVRFDARLVEERINQQKRELGKIKLKEILALCGFFIAVFLWIFPSILSYVGFKGLGSELQKILPEGVVALLASCFLFVTSCQDKDCIKRIDWGTILLLGGGLSLGSLIFETGLANVLGETLVKILPIHGSGFVFFWALVTSFLTEVTSNTAISNVMIPIVISIAGAVGEKFLDPVLAVTMAASYAFMLPVGTPPNAIVYGSGLVPITKMIRVGFWLNLAGVCVIWLFLSIF